MFRKQTDKTRNDCPLEKSVPSYVQGELSGTELIEFEEHLRNCLSCQESVDEIQEIIHYMQQTPPEPLTDDLAHKVLEKIPAQAWGNAHLAFKKKYIFHIAKPACAILMTIGITLFFILNSEKTPSSNMQSDFTDEFYSLKNQAFEQALDWLAKTQESTGAWDVEKWGGHRDYTVGLTALALSAFMSSDSKSFRVSYSDQIKRGIKYLVQQQNIEGYFGPMCSSMLYNHGIATGILLEAYELTKDKHLKAPIDRAVNYICISQTPDGGWGYAGRPNSTNTSISIWQLRALLLAHTMGWENIKGKIENGLKYLKSMMDDKGYVGYSSPLDFPYGNESLTAMAAFCLFASGYKDTDNIKIQHSLRKIASNQNTEINYYQLYFLSYALYAAEEKQAKYRIANFQKILVESQVKDTPYLGSWNPCDRWGKVGGRIYATAMASLCLQADQRALNLIGLMNMPHY